LSKRNPTHAHEQGNTDTRGLKSHLSPLRLSSRHFAVLFGRRFGP